MRIYHAVSERLDAFNGLFRDHLLPVQLRHGARLVGRWVTTDSRVVAVWEYDDMAHYERVEAAVRSDPDSAAAQRYRAQLGGLFTAREEVFMTSTP
jgi:NIPSNAP